MKFTSTRDGSVSVGGAAAVVKGSPENGGLFVPESLPKIVCKDLLGLDYAERTEAVLNAFLDFKQNGIRQSVYAAFDDDLVPTVKLDDDLFVAELWHGKTCTADDIALAVVPCIKKNARSANGINSADEDNNICLDAADERGIERIAAQTAYCFSAYCDLVESDEIQLGDKVDLVVPVTGKGNVLAAWYAREMGLPVSKIVCGTDKCGAFAELISTGTFSVDADTKADDMLIANELERLLFSVSGNNSTLTKERMQELDESGMFTVTQSEAEKLREAFACVVVDDEQTESALCEAFDEHDYLADIVTATAFAAENTRERVRTVIITAVAHPYTTPSEVLYALGENGGARIKDMLNALEDISAMEIPEALKQTE